MYPSVSKANMRYRGPMESNKMNQISQATGYDLFQVNQKLESLQAEIQTFQSNLLNGTADGMTGVIDRANQLKLANEEIQMIKEEM